MNDIAKPRLLGLSGSLRQNSYSTAILTALAERVSARAVLSLHPLGPVPMYNQDDDGASPPPAVAALRDAIAGSDAVVIACPEYNHGIPGMLKDALDWASRPRDRCVLTGKPVLSITSSPASTGGVRAHSQLHETLLSMSARIVLRPQAVIDLVHQKVRDGRLVDEASLAFLDAAIGDLLLMIDAPSPVAIEQA